MLRLTNICKTYGPMEALRGITFEVGAREFFSILGPSGSGKSTLLKLLGGFDTPSSGSLCFNGQHIETLPPNRRPFNMVFQNYALFPHLNVWKNIAFGPERKGLPKAEIHRRVSEALELVAMQDFAQGSVNTLSGGQQQRVAIARALVNRPEILLLDEPLAALDLKLRQRMQTELKALQRRLGIAFIYVTHAQDEALALSDRVAVMNQGQVEQIATPYELYHEPESLFVAQFIGSTNILRAEIKGIEPDTYALTLRDFPGSLLFVPRRSHWEFKVGDPVLSIVRPEDINIDHETGSLSAKVLALHFKGSSITVELGLKAKSAPLITMEHWAKSPRIGESLKLSIDSEAIVLLKDSGTAHGA